MIRIKKSLVFYLSIMLFTFSCSNEIIESEIDETQSEFIIAKAYNSSIETRSFTTKRYVANLDYVLGDVKQALITNKFRTRAQIDNALKGFEELGVNGIRIPIFPRNSTTNQAMFDYFYNQAKAKGFKIFANPAQGGGGTKIVNGSLTGPQTSPKNILNATTILVNVIREFSNKYKCDWINPFNEDGRPNTLFTTRQINDIYAGLRGRLNGAELIGSGVWGIPASTQVLKQTNIRRYITISTTHNLGHNHGAWKEFIRESGNLPVWDSEANESIKSPNKDTRIEAAIKAGVNGIVLYNSWRYINLNTGALNSAGQTVKDQCIQYYFIQNKSTGKRIKPFRDNDNNSLMVQVPGFWDGDYSQWEFIPTSNGYFRFRNKKSKKYFRPKNSNNFSDVVSVGSFSGSGSHVQWKISDSKDGYLYIENRATRKKIRSRNAEDISTNNNANVIKINQAPSNWLGNATQWKLIPAKTIVD